METGNGHIDDQTLIRYLLEECSPAQAAAVEEWLKRSEENRHHFDQIAAAWNLSGSLPSADHLDIDKAWNKVNSRLNDKPHTSSADGNKLRFYLYRAAAVFLLFAASYAFYQLVINQPEDILLQSENAVVQQKLSDGSEVALNSGSKLTYPENFGSRSREVELEGEAFFDINPDKSKPFIIRTAEGFIKVLGTSFNVQARPGKMTRVQVISGLVALGIENSASRDTSMVYLKAGMSGFIDPVTQKAYREEKENPAALFWFNQSLMFNKTPLPEVFEILEEHYKIPIQLSDSTLAGNCKLNARFEGDDIYTVIEVIATSFGLHWNKENDRIKISGQPHDCSL